MTPLLFVWVLANALVIMAIPMWTGSRGAEGENLRNRLLGLWVAINAVLALCIGFPSILKGDLFWFLFSLFLLLLIFAGLRKFLAK